MPRVSDKEKLARKHTVFREDFTAIVAVQYDSRKQSMDDRRFAHVRGAQWDGLLGEQMANRPKVEINKVQQALDQIENDYNDNQMDARFMTRTGAMDTPLATSMESVYRSDITDKGGMRALRVCFREGIAGGMGAVHLLTCYEDPTADPDREEDEEDEEGDEEYVEEPQRTKLEPIFDADKFVFYDLGARKDDKSDAMRCYLLHPLERKEYNRRYPERNEASWPSEICSNGFDWATPDVVYLVSVYEVEYVPDVEYTYRPPSPAALTPGQYVPKSGQAGELPEKMLWKSDIEDDPDEEQKLLAMGYVRIRKRKVKRKRVHKYLMDGMGIIKDYEYIAGSEIPVIPFYAKRYYIDNVEHFHGHVRNSRDPQQVKNALVSKLLEGSAISTFEKAIVTDEQIEGHEEEWATDNVENNAFLTLNSVMGPDGKTPLGPVGWTKSPQVPPVTGALHTLVDADLKEILGNFEEVTKTKSHVPGKALDIVERHVSPMTKLYLNNMAETVRRVGEVWLGMAPEVYYEKGRKVKGVGPRSEVKEVELYKPMMTDDGVYTQENDFSRAKFDVVVKVGPYSETEDEAAVEQALKLVAVTEDPQTKLVFTLHAATHMKGPKSEQMQQYAHRKLVEIGAYEPTPEEAQALERAKANQQPTPMDQLALAQAAEAAAKANNADAQRALTLARAGQTQAQTVKTEADALKTRVETEKVIADAHLDRDRLKVDAAKTQHDASIAEAQLSAPGQDESEGSSGSA